MIAKFLEFLDSEKIFNSIKRSYNTILMPTVEQRLCFPTNNSQLNLKLDSTIAFLLVSCSDVLQIVSKG